MVLITFLVYIAVPLIASDEDEKNNLKDVNRDMAEMLKKLLFKCEESVLKPIAL